MNYFSMINTNCFVDRSRLLANADRLLGNDARLLGDGARHLGNDYRARDTPPRCCGDTPRSSYTDARCREMLAISPEALVKCRSYPKRNPNPLARGLEVVANRR